MACAARLGEAQSRPQAIALVALLAAVPLVAGLDGLVVLALLTALLAVLVVAEQSRGPTRSAAAVAGYEPER
jgi:UDP-N-acetylmuramyl pentapeptide phosphotransferase/UDP-N-acetylglucosamine-1-phosphate transferase